MALTPDQETFLATFADAGIAEQQAASDRNTQIAKDEAIKVARDAVKADLDLQAQTLIDTGLADFDKNVAPTIEPEK